MSTSPAFLAAFVLNGVTLCAVTVAWLVLPLVIAEGDLHPQHRSLNFLSRRAPR